MGRYDIILCGEESLDGSTGQVPPGIAEWLNIPHITKIIDIEIHRDKNEAYVKRRIRGGYELVAVKMPFVASVEFGANIPRFPKFKMKEMYGDNFPIQIWNIKDLQLKPNEVGFKGSATIVIGVEMAKLPERRRECIKGDVIDIAKKLLDILKSKY